MDKIVYISFDIECAQSFPNYSPMCNFGYVVYDENLNLIKKEDIIINPKAKFRLTGRKGHRDISMAYPESEYEKAPLFSQVYKKIKSILETENAIIIGQAVENDINYLNWEIHQRKTKYDSINFKSYDLRDFVKVYEGKGNNSNSLASIKERMNLIDFIEHKADDDANIVILTVKKMLEELNISFDELVELSGALKYESKDGIMFKPYLTKKELFELRIKEIQKNDNIESKFSNKKISYSSDFEKSNLIFEIIQRILNINSDYSSKVSETEIFIESLSNEKRDKRKETAESLGLKIITFNDIMNF